MGVTYVCPLRARRSIIHAFLVRFRLSWMKAEVVEGRETGRGNLEEIRVWGEVGVGGGGDFPQGDGRDGGGRGGEGGAVEAAEGGRGGVDA